jgi:hypothetical protein
MILAGVVAEEKVSGGGGGGGGATPALIAHTSVVTPGFESAGTPLTSAGIDTTGAGFLVLFVDTYQAPQSYPLAISDSNNNQWHALSTVSGNHTGQLFYSYRAIAGGPVVVGPGHTFTLIQATCPFFVAVMCVEAWSGVQSSSDPLKSGSDQVLAGVLTGVSETPASTNDLIVMGTAGYGFGSVSIDTGFTITDSSVAGGGFADSAAMAYLVAPSSGAVDPTWVTSATIQGSINGAVFKHA